MRGDGVLVAPGMLDGEAVRAGFLKAQGAILGLFQETGLQDPQGVVHSENRWRHHRYHAFPGLDAQAASAAAVRARGGRWDRTLYADPPPPPCRVLARKCRTMGAKGALRKFCLT